MIARPLLLLMAGLPGAGKSTLAAALGRALNLPVLDKDTIKAGLLEFGASEALAGPASYALLLDLAQDLIVHQGRSVILDSPALYAPVIDRAKAIAAAGDAELRVLLCLAPGAVRAERVAARERLRSQLASVDPTEGDGSARFGHLPRHTIPVWTDGAAAAMVTAALDALSVPAG